MYRPLINIGYKHYLFHLISSVFFEFLVQLQQETHVAPVLFEGQDYDLLPEKKIPIELGTEEQLCP